MNSTWRISVTFSADVRWSSGAVREPQLSPCPARISSRAWKSISSTRCAAFKLPSPFSGRSPANVRRRRHRRQEASRSTCPECKGTGSKSVSSRADAVSPACPRCNGTRATSRRSLSDLRRQRPAWLRPDTIRVNIPPGADPGNRFVCVVKAKRDCAAARQGDLYITPRIRPHPLFTRSGNDLPWNCR